MALTPSNMLELGIQAPSFSLPDTVSGKNIRFADVKKENGTVVMFICNHCPYVIHVFDEIIRLANDYQKKGFGFVAISSNDVSNYPDDRPELMAELAGELGFTFPYLYDASQEVAKAYDAACTPDFYVFDALDILVYRGRIDDSRPGNGIPLSGKDMRHTLDLILKGESITEVQYPSMGCNIKWIKQ